MSTQKERGKLRIVQGKVISDKMDKTRVVLIETPRQHPLFQKMIKRSRKIHVHDEGNECKLGDTVMAVETRPLSRTKRHRLYKIVERAR
ncbi:MAG: 30S ribosomal protein S17 [Leptospiraceae bacterium]|nr:30S ribosomal protein S17 [Leptospiraceae bacterium]